MNENIEKDKEQIEEGKSITKADTVYGITPKTIIIVVSIILLTVIGVIVSYSYLGYWLYQGTKSDWEWVSSTCYELVVNLPMCFIRQGLHKVYAKNSIERIMPILLQQGHDAVPFLAELYYKEKSDENKRVILESIGALGKDSNKALALLREVILDLDSEFRHTALIQFSKIASKEQAEDFLLPFINDADLNIRVMTAYTLIKFGIKESKMIGLLIAESEQSWGAQRGVIFSYLGELGGRAKSAFPAIYDSFIDLDYASRDRAIDALRDIDLETSISQIASKINNMKGQVSLQRTEIEQERYVKSLENLEYVYRALKNKK